MIVGAALCGIVSINGCKEPEPESFGTIRVEMAPANDASVFAGTTRVVATVNYEKCLREWYLDVNPEQQQDGPDGGAVFDEWAERLCTGYDDIPDCEVEEITQTLIENTNVYTLRVTYQINDPSTLAYRELHIGPLPTEEMAGCNPLVELQASGLSGRNSDNQQIWRISTLPGSNEAATGQGAALSVEIVPQ